MRAHRFATVSSAGRTSRSVHKKARRLIRTDREVRSARPWGKLPACPPKLAASATDRRTDLEVRPAGMSLMEVLAAILIMSVGVLSVMTLFPISVIRSLQATQLTNTKILSFQADELVTMHRLVSDEYIPTPVPGDVTHAVIDPYGWHDMAADVGLAFANEYGNDGSNPVQYDLPETRFPIDPNAVPVWGSGPVSDAVPTPLRRLGLAATPIPPYPDNQIFGTAPEDRDDILRAVGLPDHFTTAFTGEPDGFSVNTAEFDAGRHDLSNVQTNRLVPGSRVTLFDLDGRRSQIRTYTGPGDGDDVDITLTGGTWQISWANDLPTDFGAISEVRVEFPEARYTWMLTVRKQGVSSGSRTEVDCVTFYNRPTGDPGQERVYPAGQPEPFDSQPVGFNLNDQPQTPSDLVEFDYSSTAPAKPRIKKGSWVFDPQHCRWYRVIEELEETAARIRLRLHRPAQDTIRVLILPEGVINVYRLRTRGASE